MQAYSDPKREKDPHALPNVEVWRARTVKVYCPVCGLGTRPEGSIEANGESFCPSCERSTTSFDIVDEWAWYWWSCFPGCLPDSDPVGPFKTEAEALADAQEGGE